MMKVFRVHDPITKEFMSTSNRNWTENVGTIFTSIQAAKKSISYQKRYIVKYLKWYTGNSSWDIQVRADWNESLAKANRCEIIEYDMVECIRYDGQGAKVNEPISPDDKGQALNPCDCLDKVDFSSI